MGLFSKIFKGIQNLLGEVIGFLTGVDFDDFDDAAGVLVNKSSNIANIPVIYGTRKVGGTRVFLSTGGNDNEYLYIALVLCEGRVSSIGDVYINDVLSTDSKYSGLVTIEKYTGRDDQSHSTLLAGANDTWGTNHKLSGVAYLAVRLKYDQNVFGSIPDIQAVVNGRRVVNPRLTPSSATNIAVGEEYEIASVGTTDFTTVGARSNTVGVQFTATAAAPAGTGTVHNFGFYRNPALALRDYLINNRYGKGLVGAQINDTAFSAAANVCDTLVTEYTGSSNNVRLLECNAVIDTKRKLFDNVKVLLQGMRGLMPFQDGQYSLLIDAAAPSGTPFRLDDSNILSDIKVTASGKNKKYNRVRAKFINPEANWQEDSVDWPLNPDTGDTTYTTFLAEDNGEELLREVRFSTITNYYSARDLARVICRASREHQLTVEVTATSEALQIAVGDVVELEHDSLGWTGAAIQEFRVLAMSLNDDGEVSLTLQEYSNVYTWQESNEQGDNNQSTLPDPFDVQPPSGLSLTQGVNVAADGSEIPYLDIAFTTSRDAFVVQYIINIIPSGFDNSEVILTTSQFTPNQITGVDPVAYLVSPALVTTYTVVVRAVNDAGVRSTAISGSIAITGDTTPPSAVTLDTPTGGVKSIGLSWTNPANDDFAYIRIQRRVSGVGNYVSIQDVFGKPSAAGAYVDGSLASATTYQYRAYAYDWSNNQSTASNEVSATTDSAPLALSNLEPRELHGYVYYQTAQASAPSTPSASDYDYGAAAGTNPFTGLTSGWGINPPVPSTNTANTGDPFWVARYYVTESQYNGTVTVEFSSPFQSTVFDGLVTFRNLNSELGDSAASLVTRIDGGLIKTGTVDLAQDTGMAIRQGKTSYSDNSNGFWLGNNGTQASPDPRFYLGDSTNHLKWDGSDLSTTGLVVKDTAGEILLDAGGAGIGQEGGSIIRNGALKDASQTGAVYLINTANTAVIDGWEIADNSSGATLTSYWGTQGVFQFASDHTVRTTKGVPVEFGETLYLAVNNFTPSGSTRAWSIQVQFFNSSGTFVSQVDTAYNSSLWGNAPQAGTRQISQVVIAVPNDSTIRTARIRIKGGSGSSYVNIWNVYLGRSPSQITPETVSTYIANASIDTAQIADLSVETLKIDDNAVTLADFTTTFPVGTGSSKTTAERETGLLPAGSAVIFLVNAIVNDANSNPSSYDLYIEIYQRTSTGSYSLKATSTIWIYSYGLDARMIKQELPTAAQNANFANGGYLKCAVKLRVHNSTTLVNGGAIEIAYIGAKR